MKILKKVFLKLKFLFIRLYMSLFSDRILFIFILQVKQSKKDKINFICFLVNFLNGMLEDGLSILRKNTVLKI